MNILDWLQTVCAILGLIISLYATSEVWKIKKKYKIGNISNKTQQSIKGNNNKQDSSNKVNIS